MTERETNRVLVLRPLAVLKLYTTAWRRDTEVTALESLRGRAPVPAVIGSATFGRHSAALIRYVRGSAPNPASALDVRVSVAALRAAHTITGPAFGRLHAPDQPSWAGFLAGRLDSYAETLTTLGLTAQARQCRTLHHALDVLGDTRPHLLHSDPNPGNVILTAHGPVLLDWELATFGDPELDLVRLAWEWRLPPARWPEWVGLDPRSPTVDLYLRLHLFSRLMSASSRPGAASAALAHRCLTELTDLYDGVHSPGGSDAS